MAQDIEAAKARIAAAIRGQYPSAARYGVESSDQGHSGYLLRRVLFDDETIGYDQVSFNQLADAVDDDLRSLAWGAFGDRDRDSDFDVDIFTGRIFRPVTGASSS